MSMTGPDGESPDERARRVVARIQAKHPCWLIMWSPWRREFTAFGRFAPVAIVIDQADPRDLLRAMREEELRSARMRDGR
jgi:hypothetical protein